MANNSYYIEIDVLEALISIIDQFEEFNNKTIIYLENSKDYKESIFNISKLANGNKVYHDKYDKKFYNSNKNIIDKISKYVNVFEFFCYTYGTNKTTNDNILFYYNYIINNIDNIQNILELLNSFKRLGIKVVTYVNDSFKNEIYEFDYTTRYGTYYLENMYAIPTILTNRLIYKTKESNYKIYTNNKNEIIVNNLLFDKRKLPSIIDKVALVKEIIELEDSIKEENELIKSAVILNVTIEDLQNQYEETEKLIQSLENINNKNEILITLKEINEQLKKIDIIKKMYNSSIKDKIDENILEVEKNIYLKIRNHIDYNSK